MEIPSIELIVDGVESIYHKDKNYRKGIYEKAPMICSLILKIFQANWQTNNIKMNILL